MKKILLLTTGGTIASQQGADGLVPTLHSDEIFSRLSYLREDYSFDNENLLDLDSSNIQPEEWKLIASRVYDSISDYDGVIITHGTDTLAYTAAALSFMLQNLDRSVVFTGSQLPINNPLSDAITNLHTAIEAVANEIKGVSIAFNRKIIAGTRAVKVSTMGFDAFESVNAECLGQIFADGTRISRTNSSLRNASGTVSLNDSMSNDVFLLKLLPGTKPEIFDMLVQMQYRGIVIEAFGTGGLHYLNRDLPSKLDMLTAAGVTVVVCSQCLYERCDLSIYEVGRRLLTKGVISGRDMTTEAAVTKLMWALGQTENRDKIKTIFNTNYAGEITI